jgi:hypothetical protein
MKNLLDNKLFWFASFLASALLISAVFSKQVSNSIVENHYENIADVVIKKLQKEYSPSPYGPGIDPDKIDVDKIKKN